MAESKVNNTRALIWLCALVAVLAAILFGVWMVLHRPHLPEGPCLEKRFTKHGQAIECDHSRHRIVETPDVVHCHCTDTTGGE